MIHPCLKMDQSIVFYSSESAATNVWVASMQLLIKCAHGVAEVGGTSFVLLTILYTPSQESFRCAPLSEILR